jgi:hypothetical protein
MHRALLVSDVLLEIFAYLDPDLSRHGSVAKLTALAALAALARTCKIFHEPAMNLLWADMYGITPLLGCVPRLHLLVYGRKVSAAGPPGCETFQSTHLDSNIALLLG